MPAVQNRKPAHRPAGDRTRWAGPELFAALVSNHARGCLCFRNRRPQRFRPQTAQTQIVFGLTFGSRSTTDKTDRAVLPEPVTPTDPASHSTESHTRQTFAERISWTGLHPTST